MKKEQPRMIPLEIIVSPIPNSTFSNVTAKSYSIEDITAERTTENSKIFTTIAELSMKLISMESAIFKDVANEATEKYKDTLNKLVDKKETVSIHEVIDKTNQSYKNDVITAKQEGMKDKDEPEPDELLLPSKSGIKRKKGPAPKVKTVIDIIQENDDSLEEDDGFGI